MNSLRSETWGETSLSCIVVSGDIYLQENRVCESRRNVNNAMAKVPRKYACDETPSPFDHHYP